MILIDFLFPKVRTLKTWLGKCLKSLFSGDPSKRNMVNWPKHCWNLHQSLFIILIDNFQGIWVWKNNNETISVSTWISMIFNNEIISVSICINMIFNNEISSVSTCISTIFNNGNISGSTCISMILNNEIIFASTCISIIFNESAIFCISIRF